MRYFVSFRTDDGRTGHTIIDATHALSTVDDFERLCAGIANNNELKSESVIITFYKELPEEES